MTAAALLVGFGCGKSKSESDDESTGGQAAESGSTAAGRSGTGATGGRATAGTGGSAGSSTGGTAPDKAGSGGEPAGRGGTQAGESGAPDAAGGAAESGGAGGTTGGSTGGSSASAGSSGMGGIGGAVEQRTCTGDFTLRTEEDVTEFAARRCEFLSGTLTVNAATLANLDGLSPTTLTGIGGDLVISGNSTLTSIAGLRGLNRIFGSLVLTDNPLLEDLSGLERLYLLGDGSPEDGLVVQGNEALTSLAAMGSETDQPTWIRAGVVLSGTALTNVEGLGGLVEAGSLTIVTNTALRELELSALEQAVYVVVASNAELETCTFPALQSLTGLTVTSNEKLASASFESLTTATEYITVAENAVLTTLGTLEALTTVPSLTVTDNPMLPQCFADELAERFTCSCAGNDETATCE